ncbi:hypothetical protein Droror1_Dr00007545 [Drosera rotundifolia]
MPNTPRPNSAGQSTLTIDRFATAAAATSLAVSSRRRPVSSLHGDDSENWALITALPPEVANNTIRLYRECLRRAKYIGHQKHNTPLLVDMVRQQFKKNMHEADPEKIQQMKDAAARGLINHMLLESEKMSGRKFSKTT